MPLWDSANAFRIWGGYYTHRECRQCNNAAWWLTSWKPYDASPNLFLSLYYCQDYLGLATGFSGFIWISVFPRSDWRRTSVTLRPTNFEGWTTRQYISGRWLLNDNWYRFSWKPTSPNFIIILERQSKERITKRIGDWVFSHQLPAEPNKTYTDQISSTAILQQKGEP